MAQNKIYFGANTVFTDTTFNKLIREDIPIRFLKNQYSVDFLRFPGGLPARYYIWNNQNLIKQAMIKYSKRHRGKNKANNEYVKNLSKRISITDSLYFKFLVYCKTNNIKPIIQLNTYYYIHHDKIYPVSKLKYEKSNSTEVYENWKDIEKNISEQLISTHRYIDTVYWEIGNEDYLIYTPEVFGKIVSIYSNLIKGSFPQDKIIIPVPFLRFYDSDNIWTMKLLSYLDNDRSLMNVDFLAPHYYKDRKKNVSDQRQLDRRIKRVSIVDIVDYYKNLIANYSNKDIKLFFTEFAIFKKVIDKKYNTQLNAILLCEYMMQFYSSNIIFGVIHHGFTQKSSALFFEKGVFNSLNYGIKPNTDNPDFPYMPPQAEMLRVFFKNVKYSNYRLLQRNNLTVLVSSGSVNQLVILNYGDSDIKIKLEDFTNEQFDNIEIESIHFNDLRNHLWIPEKNTVYSTINDPTNQINLKSHSLIFLNN